MCAACVLVARPPCHETLLLHLQQAGCMQRMPHASAWSAVRYPVRLARAQLASLLATSTWRSHSSPETKPAEWRTLRSTSHKHFMESSATPTEMMPTLPASRISAAGTQSSKLQDSINSG